MRMKYSAETKQKVIATYDRGEDWRLIASALAVNLKTADNWLRRHESGLDGRPHGGWRYQKLTETDIDQLVDWIAENPVVTLSSMQARLKLEYGKEVSISTIANRLDGRLITVKKIRPFAETMDSVENLEKRKK